MKLLPDRGREREKEGGREREGETESARGRDTKRERAPENSPGGEGDGGRGSGEERRASGPPISRNSYQEMEMTDKAARPRRSFLMLHSARPPDCTGCPPRHVRDESSR